MQKYKLVETSLFRSYLEWDIIFNFYSLADFVMVFVPKTHAKTLSL